ncbi:helix-turn-helix transcriptional regulator [Streptomyces sp. SID3343]|uniref:helix-turn-helix domain-containing protein n=1 Tax=Streptomyces sp. SID3343 TaxID=2690260 RepID=UPI00136AD564|nr:helix-turn-helix transcriptional regulator [Streptomyces sp. SID3343]MYW05310.1 helix-turn-helix domain-containing protein [Streptomyces sp. SID3343]
MARPPRKRKNDDDRPPTWRAYGKLVQLFRERAGLTQAELADAVGYSVEQVASIEQGRRPAKEAFTLAAETTLSALGVLQALQEDVDLAKLPAFFRDFALLETEALSRFAYEPLLVPGLLQTKQYAEALLRANCPPFDEETFEQHLEARMDRQTLLTRVPAVELSFLIGEAVLHCPVGGRAVLKAQFHRLLEAAQLSNVEVQIMPMSFGAHAGLNGPMVLVETIDHRRVTYIESQDESMVISDPDRVSRHELRYGKLRSQALNVSESARLIERVAGEL